MELRRESEEKELGEHFAVLDQANCYAEVPNGSLAGAWAVKLELGQMTAVQACSVESYAAVFRLDSSVDWIAVEAADQVDLGLFPFSSSAKTSTA